MSIPSESIRVLVVDDNEHHARLAVEYLQMGGPYAVEVAHSLKALWAHLAERDYEVVLLDYNLPDGNGLEALEEIAARGYRLPVVMVTGRGDERVAAQAIQRGAVDYLVKAGNYWLALPALVNKAARTQRLMLEAQRSLEKIRYQAMLLDNVSDAVVVWNVHGEITFWNRAAETLFGGGAAERIGQPVGPHLAAFEPPPELPVEASSVNVERRYRRPGSPQTLWVSSSVTALADEAGRVSGYMDVARDISQRKQLETQLAQAARLAAIGELASGVAHQISNPLTAIIAETQLLQQEMNDPSATRESLKAIEQAGWRAQEAIQQLLAFSRPAADTLERLAVNTTIENAVALVGAHIASLGIGLSLELSAGLPGVRGNAHQLEDVWVNLLRQARDAASDGRPHHIHVRSCLNAQGQVEVEVHDDGALIPAAQLPSIFEPDFVGFADGRGAGLELSICREIVRQHHGQISVDSAAGRGTTFTVQLPAEDTHGRG